jgi:hypothetical protein
VCEAIVSHSDETGLHLMIYDRTCRGRGPLPGLSHAWWTGARLYRALGRLDAHHGVRSWEEALDWLAGYEPERPIAQVQYWGHGKWGNARIEEQCLDASSLLRASALRPNLDRVGARMLPEAEGLWWFRTCETFGARPGQRFARDFSELLGCRVAGHTYIIGHWQSGLHTLLPGRAPTWPDDEALLQGTPESPEQARWSKLSEPNTITFLTGAIPPGY